MPALDPAAPVTPDDSDGDVAPRATAIPPAAPQPAAGERWLDVRGLEPPEPMLHTLAALESLGPHDSLIQVNVRVPQFLLPELAARGFDAEVDESRADRVLVRIRRGAPAGGTGT